MLSGRVLDTPWYGGRPAPWLSAAPVGTSRLVTTARMAPGWTHPPRQPVDRVVLTLGAGLAWLLLVMAGIALLSL